MDEQAFVYVTMIGASPEKVWEALTTASFTQQYWHATRVQSDWEQGSPIAFLVDGEQGDEVGCDGKILVVDRPRELSYTWHFPRNDELADEAPSRVTFRLEAIDDYTRLTVIHDEFAPSGKMREMVSHGWPHVIAGLKTLVETGRAIDFSRY